MKIIRAALILGLALSAVSVFAGPRQKFVADEQGAVNVPVFPPLGTPPMAMFYEPDWQGTVSQPSGLSQLTYTWTAFGEFTVADPDLSKTPWTIHVTGLRFTMTFYNGKTQDAQHLVGTIEGTFKTVGTLNPSDFTIHTTGTYAFTSGTGIFAHVRGAGTVGAVNSNNPGPFDCPMEGWIEY